MSRFLDTLERINRGPTTSMGFGTAARTEKVPAMALLGILSDPGKSVQGAATLARIDAEGALIEGKKTEKTLKKIAQTLDSVPWGVGVQELNGEQVSHYREHGCDFLAFGPERALVGAIGNEDTAFLLRIQPDMDERSLRAIEYLPVDAVLLSLGYMEPPLTIQHLITVGSVRDAFSKYLLLEVPGVLTAEELESLRDMGVDGLGLDATAVPADELEGLKERILALPRQQRNRTNKASAILPRTTYTPPGVPSHEEEEEEGGSWRP